MNRSERDGLTFLHLPAWDETLALNHGFLTRSGGVSPHPYATLNLGPFSGDPPSNIETNLRRVARALGISPERVFCARQVHGAAIREAHSSDILNSAFTSPDPFQCDGLVTDEPGVFLGVLSADCLPILLFDPARPAVAAIHAGWRGTLQGISEKAVGCLRAWYGSKPEDLQAAFGPAIGPCCYRVGEDVATRFRDTDPGTGPCMPMTAPGQWSLDLAALNRRQFLRSGLRLTNLFFSGSCTRCFSDQFFSVRAQGDPTGRLISVIGLRLPQEARPRG